MKLIFDIEADNLLKEATKVHCIVTNNVDTNEVNKFRPQDIKNSIDHLLNASTLIGHNILDYDLRLLDKLHNLNFKGEVVDTLVYARTIWPDIKVSDLVLAKKGKLPPKLVGSHKLKAWGYRLGILKGEFGEQEDAFDTFTEDLLDYCEKDVEVTTALYNKIVEQNFCIESLNLETKIHTLLIKQEETGFPFDVEKASKFYASLLQKKMELEKHLQEVFEPTYVELKTKTKIIPFNPNSRQQIADRLQRRGWKPKDFTPTNQPIVDELVLSKLDIPEAKLLVEYLLLTKRLGQIQDGKNGWLKLEVDGRIHGRVNHMGAVTSRCSHAKPNIAAVPKVIAPYGKECRELFTGTDEYHLFGTDASGLELRCLAHYLAAFDNGEYVDIVLNGDIHTVNQQAAGLPTRDMAKTFIYGWLYGAGDEKIGSIVNKGAREGKKIKETFLSKLPAIKTLKDKVGLKANQGFLKGLDGRRIPIRHSHAALNTLLQSAGAIICKQWYCFVYELIQERGVDANIVAFIHDELQILVRKGQEEQLGAVVKEAMKMTEEHFNFRCPLDCDYSFGSNWAETH